jgi:TonB family protein
LDTEITASWKQWEGHVVDGQFALRQYCGGGEIHAVFLTELDGDPSRRAAIKLVMADPRTADLRLSRWQEVSKLQHPHLVRLFSAGRCLLGGTALIYVVMERADEVLSQVLADRPLTAAETREMLGPALSALEYLHQRGLAHSHLKPANIMAMDDRLKISSDDVCRIGGPEARWERSGMYDPPEIASEGASPAGDVWSLGVTLVECLTQRLPFPAGSPEPDRALLEALPDPFRDIAAHCLQSSPRNRWTVAEIAASPGPMGSSARPRALPKLRYILAAAALGLVGLMILLGRRAPSDHSGVGVAPAVGAIAPEANFPQPQPVAPPRVAAPPPKSVAAKPKPPAKAGDVLWTEVADQVVPDVPPKARNTIQGKVTVRVKVTVDPAGSVSEVTLDSPESSRYFAGLSMKAAKKWKFRPVKVGDRDASQEWALRFEYTKAGSKVFPERLAP